MKPISYILITLLFTITGCKKYLEEKPDKTLSEPTTVAELQALLDRGDNTLSFPVAGELSDDNLYFTTTGYNTLFYPADRGAYIWDAGTDLSKDWTSSYKKVFNANVVLSELDQKGKYPENSGEYNTARGHALFLRAFTFYQLAQLFAPAYSAQSADMALGIPLKTSPNIEDPTTRSTVKETYDKIIADARESARLLPPIAIAKTRPARVSAYALLARTYLAMRDYSNALLYADSSLAIYSTLLDYNDPSDVEPFAETSFQIFNKEVIFHAIANGIYEIPNSRVDSILYKSYHDDDLRKYAFFFDNQDGSYTFKGNYYGLPDNRPAFMGITSAEVLLTRAECNARLNKVNEGLADLNNLLVRRYASGTFTPVAATDANDAVIKILMERRKELCFRPGLRWSDLRRLNQDNATSITLKRIINGQTYILQPDDKRWVFLIPPSVVQISGITQNPR